jgi:hypothetical protein
LIFCFTGDGGIKLGIILMIFLIPRSFSSEVPCPDQVTCVEGWDECKKNV